jgi:hypothetical protein
VLEEEEEPPDVSEEEKEPPASIEEEEPLPTSPLSRLMKPPPNVRGDEQCSGGWSFPPHGVREEEERGSREKQTSCSGLRLASSRILNAC